MTTVIPIAATELAATAAASVVVNLASSEPLTVGQPTTEHGVADSLAHALVAPFTGAVTGELALLIDDDLAAALREATIGPLELAAALAPTLEAVSVAVGSLALGQLQQLEPRLALSRVFARDDAALVPLQGAQSVRAALAIGIDAGPAEAADQPAAAAPQVDRLDLLRGVEMEATAELGRARMTVNDLLTLRSGAVIELDRVAGAPADLFVNGRLIARGEVVVVDENYGLRITQVITDDSPR